MFLQAYSTDKEDYINTYQTFTYDEKGFNELGRFTGKELTKDKTFKVVVKKFEGKFPELK